MTIERYMIRFSKRNEELILTYTPESADEEWVNHEFEAGNSIPLRKHIFVFRSEDLIRPSDQEDVDESSYDFLLGTDDGEYFLVSKRILNLKYDLRLYKDMKIDIKTFIAHRDISIFRKIDALVNEEIIIGGSVESAIPLVEFELLRKKFPGTTELNHYANSRISRILKEYLGTMSDSQTKLEAYLRRRNEQHAIIRSPQELRTYELEKYTYVRDRLKEMLRDYDSYSESDWQKSILQMILLIMPKYILCLSEVKIKDFYSPRKEHQSYIERRCDLMLVGSSGYIDLIEIKKPFPSSILSARKYRELGYTPKKELSGSVIQIEKYLFYLNKWGIKGEEELTATYQDKLPSGLTLRVTNPKGIIILGRDEDFDDEQQVDFEIIRRKYANLVDIITYDDLIRRMDVLISMLSTRVEQQ